MSKLEEEIGRRFRCAKCGNASGTIRRFTASGAGLSRLIDWQNQQYLAVVCGRCGYTEVYDAETLGEKDDTMSILDLIFGVGD
jgi:predicted nucleic-acid-binding Zn-ribbon protein